MHRELTWADLVRESEEDGRRAYRAGGMPRPPLRDGRCAAYWRGWDAAKAAAAATATGRPRLRQLA